MSTPDLMPGGQVTIADLFRVLTSIQERLGTVVTKLEVNDNKHQEVKETVVDHESRIRNVESAYQRARGQASIIGGIVGAIVGFLTSFLQHVKF